MQTRELSFKGVWKERDMQRQRCYSAEGMMRHSHPEVAVIAFPEIADVAREVRRILNSRRVWKAFPFMSPRVQGERASFRITDGRGARTASGGAFELTFPRHSRKLYSIIHEIAHLLHAREQYAVRDRRSNVDPRVMSELLFLRKGYTAGHGWRYCQILLQLVRWFIGKSAHDDLKKHFKGMRVRFRPPRVMSPEQRAAAAQRLAKLRPKAEYFRREALAA